MRDPAKYLNLVLKTIVSIRRCLQMRNVGLQTMITVIQNESWVNYT